MPLYSSREYTWRQSLNPIRGLTMAIISTALDNAEMGLFSELTWLYRFIEKRDGVLRAVKRRRQSAIGRMDWSVKVKAKFEEDPKAEAQQKALTEAYELVDNLNAAIKWLALAEFRGYAHLEKWWGDGYVTHLEPVPQWFWVQKWPNKNWLFDKSAASSPMNAVKADMKNFVLREVDDPVDEVALPNFIRKNMGRKDWDAFVETYGIPPLFLVMPQNASPNDVATYQDVAENVIGDGRGALPYGTDIKAVTVGDRNANPFKEHVGYCDEDVVLAGTSGKLTVLNDPTGLGSGQSEVHKDTFDELADAEGGEIAEIFQKQFDAPFLAEQFPDQEVMVYFAIHSKPTADVKNVVDDVSKLSAAGYKVERQQVTEKTGYQFDDEMMKAALAPKPSPFGAPKPEDEMFGEGEEGGEGEEINADSEEEGEEIAQRGSDSVPGGRLANASQSAETEALEKMVRDAYLLSVDHDLRAVRDRLALIMDIQDNALREEQLRKLQDDLPDLLQVAAANPESGKVLEQATTAALFNGMAAGQPVPQRLPQRKRKTKRVRVQTLKDDKGNLIAVKVG